MAGEIDGALRSASGYDLGLKAMAMMQRAKVWPTPINYEIWLHCAGDPDGGLAQAVERLIASGEPITEEVSERLAATFLPARQVQEQIRDAGDQLSRQMETVTKAVASAQRSSQAYGRTLGAATRDLEAEQDAERLKAIAGGLSDATRRVHEHNKALEKKLAASSAEMVNLRTHLEQVRRDSMTDALTTLANRKAFDEALKAACEQCDASGGAVGLGLIDIDHFKAVNDTWGHQTGDQVIRFVATVLQRVAAPPAVAARYGGEEFAVVCPGATPADMSRIMETVREEVGGRVLKRRATNEDIGAVTVSAGWAVRSARETCAAFTERADQALYASKRTGRNRVTAADAPRPAKKAA